MTVASRTGRRTWIASRRSCPPDALTDRCSYGITVDSAPSRRNAGATPESPDRLSPTRIGYLHLNSYSSLTVWSGRSAQLRAPLVHEVGRPYGPTAATPADPDDLTTGELITRVTTQVSTLIRDELALARVKVTQTGKKAGVGARLLGGAGIAALCGVGAMLTTVTAALALPRRHQN
ncbi:phage holin family protein [Cryptosporangium phraense]